MILFQMKVFSALLFVLVVVVAMMVPAAAAGVRKCSFYGKIMPSQRSIRCPDRLTEFPDGDWFTAKMHQSDSGNFWAANVSFKLQRTFSGAAERWRVNGAG